MNEKTKESFETLEEFVALANLRPYFTMRNKSRVMKFCKMEVGKAVLIYGTYQFHEDGFACENNLNLVAIIADGVTYIKDPYTICTSYFGEDMELPENTVLYGEAYHKMELHIKEELVNEYLDSLEIDQKCLESLLKEARKDARRILLHAKPQNARDYLPVLEFADNRFSEHLCGFIDLEALAREHMEEHKKDYVEQKLYEQALEAEIQKGDMVEEWEVWMANALHDTDGKNVMATFLVDGKEYEEKLLCDKLLYCLQQGKSIDQENCFSTWSREKEFLPLVHAESSWKNDYRPLKHQDITTIKYRGKIIYEKKEGEN